MFESILSLLCRYERIILHRHTCPDGDALGSQIGLKHLILANLPGKEVHMVGDAPGRYAFMEDSAPETLPDEAFSGALAVILDTSAPALISDPRYTLAAATARIDHHIFCGRIADTEVTDTAYESCCGLVIALAMEAGWKVPPIAANALYTGMVTDSGRFRYDSISAGTFLRAAFLMEQAPIPLEEIYGRLYEEELSRIRLRGRFMNAIQLTPAGTAYIYTDRATMDSLGVDTFSISRGMANLMADIKGVCNWVNFTECPQGVLCELRSNRCNINPIAVKYGGGGHAKASGATLPDRETAMAMLQDLDALSREALHG